MPKQPYVLTPEQLALQEERRRKRTEAKASTHEDFAKAIRKGTIVSREWRQVVERAPGARSLRIMTWNLLAQCLVRRELFPTSDCLRASQREHMTFEELLTPDAEVLCLQEVDRLEKILPVLDKAGYDHHYASGPRKKHGCLIAWRRNAFTRFASRTLLYDDAMLRNDGDDAYRKGASFRTRNIANMLALECTDGSGEGFVIATTHLFWHPAYAYERARQLGLLKRESLRFRATRNPAGTWPIILAGDFNFSPESAAYALLFRAPLSPAHRARLAASRVVHVSIDPMVPLTSASAAAADDDEEGAEGAEGAEADPDRVITNSRLAGEADGLLDDDELEALYSSDDVPVRSAYDDGQRTLGSDAIACGSRLGIAATQKGAFEPEFTNYTPYWKLTLDYILVIDPPGSRSKVLGLLSPPNAKALDPGLPKKGVSASDHVSLCAELQWTLT